jgi:hypothetical protein
MSVSVDPFKYLTGEVQMPSSVKQLRPLPQHQPPQQSQLQQQSFEDWARGWSVTRTSAPFPNPQFVGNVVYSTPQRMQQNKQQSIPSPFPLSNDNYLNSNMKSSYSNDYYYTNNGALRTSQPAYSRSTPQLPSLNPQYPQQQQPQQQYRSSTKKPRTSKNNHNVNNNDDADMPSGGRFVVESTLCAVRGDGVTGLLNALNTNFHDANGNNMHTHPSIWSNHSAQLSEAAYQEYINHRDEIVNTKPLTHQTNNNINNNVYSHDFRAMKQQIDYEQTLPYREKLAIKQRKLQAVERKSALTECLLMANEDMIMKQVLEFEKVFEQLQAVKHSQEAHRRREQARKQQELLKQQQHAEAQRHKREQMEQQRHQRAEEYKTHQHEAHELELMLAEEKFERRRLRKAADNAKKAEIERKIREKHTEHLEFTNMHAEDEWMHHFLTREQAHIEQEREAQARAAQEAARREQEEAVRRQAEAKKQRFLQQQAEQQRLAKERSEQTHEYALMQAEDNYEHARLRKEAMIQKRMQQAQREKELQSIQQELSLMHTEDDYEHSRLQALREWVEQQERELAEQEAQEAQARQKREREQQRELQRRKQREHLQEIHENQLMSAEEALERARLEAVAQQLKKQQLLLQQQEQQKLRAQRAQDANREKIERSHMRIEDEYEHLRLLQLRQQQAHHSKKNNSNKDYEDDFESLAELEALMALKAYKQAVKELLYLRLEQQQCKENISNYVSQVRATNGSDANMLERLEEVLSHTENGVLLRFLNLEQANDLADVDDEQISEDVVAVLEEIGTLRLENSQLLLIVQQLRELLLGPDPVPQPQDEPTDAAVGPTHEDEELEVFHQYEQYAHDMSSKQVTNYDELQNAELQQVQYEQMNADAGTSGVGGDDDAAREYVPLSFAEASIDSDKPVAPISIAEEDPYMEIIKRTLSNTLHSARSVTNTRPSTTLTPRSHAMSAGSHDHNDPDHQDIANQVNDTLTDLFKEEEEDPEGMSSKSVSNKNSTNNVFNNLYERTKNSSLDELLGHTQHRFDDSHNNLIGSSPSKNPNDSGCRVDEDKNSVSAGSLPLNPAELVERLKHQLEQ